ncbi:MAG: YfiR family protein [Pseudomonadota bacterium]
MRFPAFKGGWFAALLFSAPCVFSQGAQDESAIKARVALAIARFAEMPVSAEREPGPLHLCVAVRGKPPVALLNLAREKVGAHGVEVQIGPPFTDCDVLYIHSSFTDWRTLLVETRAPALTVGDVPGFISAGGMVELLIDNDSVRFDVNLVAVRAAHIRLPAQVLKLARIVRE